MNRVGMAYALAAFVFWGLAPIYFKAIAEVPAGEIIAHRIIWSVPVLLLFLLLRDGRALFARLKLPWKQIGVLLVTGTLVAVNWLVFVWAVNHDQVLATSLGYFINPLVSVALGVLLLGEKLTRLQTVAVVLAGLGTLYLGVWIGQAPWISLFLAFSFGFYGLIRKRLDVGPMTGLLWETALLTIPAAIYLVWFVTPVLGVAPQLNAWPLFLLLLAGFVTVVPLIWYNAAAKKLELSTVGFFQYLAPTITFFLAVFLYGEPFTHGHKVAFVCIWVALLMISVEPIFRARRRRLPT